MKHNIVVESALDLSGTGMEASSQMEDWGLLETGLEVAWIPWLDLVCLVPPDPSSVALVELTFLVPCFPIILWFGGRVKNCGPGQVPQIIRFPVVNHCLPGYFLQESRGILKRQWHLDL